MSIIMDLFNLTQHIDPTLTDESFWSIIDTIDSEYEGDSEAVVSSLVRHLSHCEDDYIFRFDDRLAELIDAIGGKEWSDDLFGNERVKKDLFLSARCRAVSMGKEHYNRIFSRKERLSDEGIYENNGVYCSTTDGLLTVAAAAWSRKNLKPIEDYPHKRNYGVSE
ncbi:MAG: DUF4240 domain-containing protein [Oscillospiraceae bacterium]|nr:DUF4240 domain-containing protein [Oscillospiraceae bacterium]